MTTKRIIRRIFGLTVLMLTGLSMLSSCTQRRGLGMSPEEEMEWEQKLMDYCLSSKKVISWSPFSDEGVYIDAVVRHLRNECDRKTYKLSDRIEAADANFALSQRNFKDASARADSLEREKLTLEKDVKTCHSTLHHRNARFAELERSERNIKDANDRYVALTSALQANNTKCNGEIERLKQELREKELQHEYALKQQHPEGIGNDFSCSFISGSNSAYVMGGSVVGALVGSGAAWYLMGKRIGGLQRQLGESTTENDSLQQQMAGLQRQPDDGTTEEDDRLRQQVIGLQGQLGESTTEIDSLQRQVADLEGQLGESTAENDSLQRQVADLQGQLDEKSEEIIGLRVRIGILEGDLRTLRSRVPNSKRSVTDSKQTNTNSIK